MFKSGIFAFLLFLGMSCLLQRALAQAAPSSSPLSSEEINQLQAKARAGDSAAQLALGKAYEDGNGMPQSDKQAVEWYKAAADQGDATAQNSLGVIFSLGRGVQQDKHEAIRWYRKAAKQKSPNAMFNLGAAYYNGDGIGVDDTASYAWFLLAQSLGDPSASDAVKRMTKRATQQCKAFEEIGDMYQRGDDLPQSTSEAIKWYRKAAATGAPYDAASVRVKLAGLLLHDQSPTSNYAEARKLCEQAANLHYPAGAYCVGELYEQGLGVPQDLSKAAKWFTEATNMGHPGAALRLGLMYWKGEGVRQDKISAYEFVYLASSSGLPEAKREKERIEKELTAEELEKGNAKAVEWTRRHVLVIKGQTLILH
jgi:TPR repeat protein